MCHIVFCNAVFSQSTSKICTLIRFTLFSNCVISGFVTLSVLLPYRFTLFSNPATKLLASLRVLLPYRFTLFSNGLCDEILDPVVLLPYRFTLFSNLSRFCLSHFSFYYLIDLHYSQTAVTRTI